LTLDVRVIVNRRHDLAALLQGSLQHRIRLSVRPNHDYAYPLPCRSQQHGKRLVAQRWCRKIVGRCALAGGGAIAKARQRDVARTSKMQHKGPRWNALKVFRDADRSIDYENPMRNGSHPASHEFSQLIDRDVDRVPPMTPDSGCEGATHVGRKGATPADPKSRAHGAEFAVECAGQPHAEGGLSSAVPPSKKDDSRHA
jgi:hypothetical protein